MLALVFYIISFIFPIPDKIYKPHVNTRSNIYMTPDLINSLEPPSGGSLKILTHLNAANWAQNWLMYISEIDSPVFDEHYYMDYFNMRGLCNIYTNTNFFYLGYYPDGVICNEGPMYISLFELLPSKRIFNCKIIMENPHYIEYNSTLKKFKYEIKFLTDKAHVFFQYTDLNTPGQLRYYLDWNYEIN